MVDGKNWFVECVTTFEPNELLTYELTDCSFPIKNLKHTYRIEKVGEDTKVKQVMEYVVKFGALGKILDILMIRKKTDMGIKKFFVGLKQFAEKN